MMKWLLPVLLAFLIAPTANANWLKNCQTGATTNTLTPGGFVCHNPASADDDPGLLDFLNCENVDVEWYDNITGDGTGDPDGTATIYKCPSVATAALDTEAERLAGCQPVAGGALSVATPFLFGLGGRILWVDIELASTENQLVVTCAQPSTN